MDAELKSTGLSSRQAAMQLGLSPSTFTRLRQARNMDVESVVRLCRWLRVPIAFFEVEEESNESQGTLPRIHDVLLRDPTLTQAQADALFTLVEVAYRLVCRKEEA